jgi:hypothetical protein
MPSVIRCGVQPAAPRLRLSSTSGSNISENERYERKHPMG